MNSQTCRRRFGCGCPVHRCLIAMSGIAVLSLATALSAQTAKPFTLQQILSAPYANQLTAAPVGNLFAWVEDAEGRHNLWVGGKDTPARQLTHYTEDDGQDIRNLAWSPDATAIAYTYGAPSGADGKPANPAHLQHPTPLTVIVQPLALDAKPITIGEGRSPLYSHNGTSLYYLRDGQIWTADHALLLSSRSAAEGSASPVSPQISTHQLVFDRGSASSLTLSPDGSLLAFLSRRRELNEPSHTFLALFDLRTHTLTFPAPSTGNDSAPAFSPDGKQLAWFREPFTATNAPEFALNRTSPNPWSIQLLDLSSSASTLATPKDFSSRPEAQRSGDEVERPAFGTTTTARTLYSPPPNQPGSFLPLPDDESPYLVWINENRLIFFSEADGFDHLYGLLSNRPNSLWPIGSGDYEVEGLVPGHYPNLLLFFSSNEGDPDRRHIWVSPEFPIDHTGTGPLTSGTGIETHSALAADGTSFAVLASDDRTPMHAGVGSLTSHELSPTLTPLQQPLLPSTYPTAALVTPQQVIFPSTDNLQIHGQLFLPPHLDAKIKHPAILFLHGGPRRQMLLGYPAMEYYSNAYAMNQYLTSGGFIVLSVNYRCGIGYGLNFRQCDHEGATGAAEYNDVLAAAKYLRSRPDVDPKRIGLWGGSYGGYLTALALARNSDIFAAGVDLHGVHDWNLEDNASDWKRGDNATQDAIGKLALASSPLGDISHWRSPILLIHGDNDPSVAYAQTPILADALRVRNSTLPKDQQVDIEELIFPDEVHEFLLHRDWLAAYTAAAAFFERTLNP